MKIFLDTADTDAIEKAYTTGIIDGITTNPTLIRKSGRDPEEVYQQLIDYGTFLKHFHSVWAAVTSRPSNDPPKKGSHKVRT